MITLSRTILSAFAASLAMVAVPATAEEMSDAATMKTVELGPKVGDAIPHNLALPNTGGEDASFETLKGENGMALFFVRSVSWCPYCKKQAVDVSERLAEFEAAGLSVVFVSYDSVDKQTEFATKNSFKPTLLSDEKIEAINAFGIRNEKHEEGSRAYGIPHPVTFILDTDGIVKSKFYEEDFLSNEKSYRNRPAVDVILDGARSALSS